tara:strand:- start:627 stop:773 length:147 start_codon:yes stop_codon:yes gene_type:complete
MIDYVQVISNVGFPIGMTFYLMLRFEKRLNENTEALNVIKDVIRKCDK